MRLILLYEDHTLLAGLRSRISSVPGADVVLATTAVAEAVEAACTADLLMVAGTAKLVVELSQRLSDTEVLSPILLVTDAPSGVESLYNPGPHCRGLLASDFTADQLAAALLAIDAGLAVLPAEQLASIGSPAAADKSDGGPLTPREGEVIEMLARGLLNKEIAAALGISENTVKFHVSSIYSKLGVANRVEAIRAAMRAGLLAV